MIVAVDLPDDLGEPKVRVQIHMADGPAFEAIVGGQEVHEHEECGGFRSARIRLSSGHEAWVFGRRDRERPLAVDVVASDGGG